MKIGERYTLSHYLAALAIGVCGYVVLWAVLVDPVELPRQQVEEEAEIFIAHDPVLPWGEK